MILAQEVFIQLSKGEWSEIAQYLGKDNSEFIYNFLENGGAFDDEGGSFPQSEMETIYRLIRTNAYKSIKEESEKFAEFYEFIQYTAGY